MHMFRTSIENCGVMCVNWCTILWIHVEVCIMSMRRNIIRHRLLMFCVPALWY